MALLVGPDPVIGPQLLKRTTTRVTAPRKEVSQECTSNLVHTVLVQLIAVGLPHSLLGWL